MAKDSDWYPRSLPEQYEMFKAIDANIIEVNKTLEMAADKETRLKEMAQVFIAFYENLLLNEAALDALKSGFTTVRKGKKGEDPMPVPPAYHDLTLPAGDFVGMEDEMREMRRYMKGLFTWSDDMGDVLKMNGKDTDAPSPDTQSPDVNILDVQENKARVRTDKEGNDGIEYNWRIAGETVWQPLVTTGERETMLEFPIAAGTAAKVELRAIFVKKFKRVGNWSPTYNLAVGN